MADIVEIEEVDKDTLSPEDLEEQFTKNYHILTETAISMTQNYINKLHGSKSLKLAVSCTENVIEIYQLHNTSLNRSCGFKGHESAPSDLVWSPVDENLLYTSGLDGCCKLWDVRTGQVATVYLGNDDDTTVLKKPFECMDVSCSGRVLCAGSQAVKDDSYIVFWDYRHPTPLGGYWNSHTNDITQVKFHKNSKNTLATASMDGLLNIFNVSEESEDDALTYTCNINSSVEKVAWLGDRQVACITDSNDIQIWDADSGDIVNAYTRNKVARSIKRSREDDCYIVDMLKPTNRSPVVLAGSVSGNGEVLRSVSVMDKRLQPATNFINNKQIVRCMWYTDKDEMLVTAGESGFITVWIPEELVENHSAQNKITNTDKLHRKRHKPY